jgi:hypothetical protein
MEVSYQLYALAASPPGKEPLDTHLIGCWVNPTDDLEAVAKR